VPENERHLHATFSRLRARDLAEKFWVLSARPKFYNDLPMDYVEVLDRIGANAATPDGPRFVVLDCWNELEIRKPKDMAITDYVRQFLVEAKRWAAQLHVCLFVTVHPTKEGAKSEEPSLYDAEGSAHWANKCDNGLIIKRDYVNSVCSVRSAKVREIGAGSIGSVQFSVDGNGIFTPLTGGDYGKPYVPNRYAKAAPRNNGNLGRD
jgi:hypothetical protein